MSGGPPHHPHNRLPAGNTAWNHLQVPNFFPRQPQHAHMSSEHPMLHQPTWHTPTTEPLKTPHSQIINVEQMLSERPYLRAGSGVDLSLARIENGDLPTAPISLSVRDTNKINSLAASALERQGELSKSVSPKPASPPTAAAAKTQSPTPDKQLSPKIKKVKRVDSILERLNPLALVDGEVASATSTTNFATTNATGLQGAAANSSHDENSNSSSLLTAPTPREEDVVSPYSNEDSLDSNKSRRKRKPTKTMKVTKEAEMPATHDTPDIGNLNANSNDIIIKSPVTAANHISQELNPNTTPIREVPPVAVTPIATLQNRRRSSPKAQESSRKTRRKTSTDDETIDNIAAMVGDLINKPESPKVPDFPRAPASTISASSSSTLTAMVTLAQKKDFVAVEDKLEEMFAGLEDPKTDLRTLDETSQVGSISDVLNAAPNLEKVSSTSNLDVTRKKPVRKKRKVKGKQGKQPKDTSIKKKGGGGLKTTKKATKASKKINGKAKFDNSAKDVYAYDSGSNASSSKSRGPFVHISGPRESPISVCVINIPSQEDDGDVKKSRTKKLNDDDIRHKVRSKGLHSSTLSIKYDSLTKDTSWICAFCKRSPYNTDFAENDAHYSPGELFGPYVITTACEEYTRRLTDPFDKSFKSKKIARSIETITSPKAAKRGPKRKISQGTMSFSGVMNEGVTDYDLGIVRLEDAMFEVWAHEDCIVWSPGTYLVGAKLVGLEEAVWTASNVQCARCVYKGANICCLKRGCTNVMHLGCAYLAQWRLNEDNFTALCSEHASSVV